MIVIHLGRDQVADPLGSPHPGTGLPVVHRGLTPAAIGGNGQKEVTRKRVDERLVHLAKLGQFSIDGLAFSHVDARGPELVASADATRSGGIRSWSGWIGGT